MLFETNTMNPSSRKKTGSALNYYHTPSFSCIKLQSIEPGGIENNKVIRKN